jgi:endonuclease YncB( thermonuclease family)
VRKKNRPAGKEAKKFAENLLKPNQAITLHIPHQQKFEENLLNSVTFDRIVGIIWIEDKNYGDVIVEAGHGRYIAKGEKPHEGI